MAEVTCLTDAIASYSSDPTAQEARSRRSCFTPVRDTSDHILGLGMVTGLSSRGPALPCKTGSGLRQHYQSVNLEEGGAAWPRFIRKLNGTAIAGTVRRHAPPVFTVNSSRCRFRPLRLRPQ